MTKRVGSLYRLVLCALLYGSSARAEPAVDADLDPSSQAAEAIDSTRLDVARLPVEAVTASRALYARGLFLEAQFGALAFAGDANIVSTPGPRFAAAVGYEVASWFSYVLLLEGSLHRTDNRAPPHPSAYELLGVASGPRFALPFGPRASIFVGGLLGVQWATKDVLRALDFRDSIKAGINYGGELGFDWHFRARHHSLGVLGGARSYPSLARTKFTLGGYGSVYLRYVF